MLVSSSAFPISYFKMESLTEPGAHSLSRLVGQETSRPAPSVPRLQSCAAVCSAVVSAADLELAPHIHTASL